MNIHDIDTIRREFATLTRRANESLGSYDTGTLGIGRYVPGSSPWERHDNGDELLYVTDGEVTVELLEEDGTSTKHDVRAGQLVVIPARRWHRLTAREPVNILFASPSEDGVERSRDHPLAQ